MNVYDYIASDLGKVRELIDELLAINLHAVQERFFEDIKSRLILHIEAKRRVFYPTLVGTDLNDIQKEDGQIVTLLEKLTEEGMTSPKWLVMFGELKHAVKHQADQADKRLFAPSRAVLSATEATALVARMEAVKQEKTEYNNLSTDHVANS